MPATNTPQAWMMPAMGSLRYPNHRAMSVAAIIVPFSTMETAELSTNLPNEFSTPDSSATTDMQSRYGIVMRVSSTARSNFSGVASKPGAKPYMSSGMAISAMTVSASRMKTSPDSASSANTRAEFLALALEPLGKQGHEGRVECALAEQPAKQVGEAERDEEGVGDRSAAERGGDQYVAKETEDAADERQAADGREGAVEVHRR